ncbi:MULTISPECIES: HAD family hydrolase [unclassified Bacillus (in: firmicutes)]|uniref:HAD family hydrolase n=1 Tax=unclassified Bacillus (in: firmicutes) TaxID=185979 RepID=UPI0008E74426|nr:MULTISPECIES: HAD hydrolase-like protein [unclassified Bacillus (in: firmicutes)]SFA71548.1 Phosphoglycolate phosphatase, HAD superfamily [Bacillus sp. UNCCL13]SFQ61751.1 Phosphoglycolate phosphatase, HAD superfamily [Bacillus sp. cl95]
MVKVILFDVDGVLLSEEHYFDASALTVWELFISKNYLSLAPERFTTNYNSKEIADIRSRVFQDDQVLEFLKSKGLNANWDMIYLTVSYQLIHLLEQVKDQESEKIKAWLQKGIDRQTLLDIGDVLNQYEVNLNFESFVEGFEAAGESKQGLFKHLDTIAFEKLSIETKIFSEDRTLWSVGEHISQEWYVGDEHVLASTGRSSVQTGKKGFLTDEMTLCPREEIDELFSKLLTKGLKIGIGTGRPELETIQPFTHLDWLKHFDANHIVTADDVLKAEMEFPDFRPLSKPNPFTYVLGLNGRHSGAQKSLESNLPLENRDEILIVGDSLADLLAARKIGCKFAAVLTGLSGQNARSEFEKNGADYILNNVLELADLLLKEN